MNSLSIIPNPFDKVALQRDLPFSCDDSLRVSQFFESTGLPNTKTPLYNLRRMAARLGLGEIYVKDESRFLRMNSFKSRGALWASARIAGRRIGLPEGAPLFFGDIAQGHGKYLLVTATDGNHGAAVAFAARLLGLEALIFMPHGTSAARIRAISDLGAQCAVTRFNYDDTVRHAAQRAHERRAILIQDTAWPGYEEIPAWIMQGYASMAGEIMAQLQGRMPTHIFLQIGVGSFAAAMASAFMSESIKNSCAAPVIIGMEAESASCLHNSFRTPKGAPHEVKGRMRTIMAGLACGRLSHIAWPILRASIMASASCHDSLAELGIRLLAEPLPGDPGIVSGESGAIGMGVLWHLMLFDHEWREKLGLDKNSRVLLISTEGATDPENWEKVTGNSNASWPEGNG